MFRRRIRKAFVIGAVLFFVIYLWGHSKLDTDANRDADRELNAGPRAQPRREIVRPDRNRTGRVTPAKLDQLGLHNQSMELDDSFNDRKPHNISGKTYYKWNDLKSGGWRILPLKKLQNGSLAPSGITKTDARAAVVYNRIPKTGSRFMMELVRKMAAMNKFYVIYSVVYNNSAIDHHMSKFVRDVGRIQTPFLLARQMFFIDFTEFKMAQPKYISIIRDPVSRVVSAFNFNRFGDGTRNRWYKVFKADMNLTLDDCIVRNESECSLEGASVTIRYFCGQDLRCKKPSEWSLQRAMDNVKRHYLAIGLTEDYQNTLKVFEKLLPDFFKGMADLYQLPSKEKTASKYHYKPSPWAEQLLRERFHLEYKFYDFIKERMDRLKKKLEI